MEAEPSTASPTFIPAESISGIGAIPEPKSMLEEGQCATPTPGLRKFPNVLSVEVHGVGDPHIGAKPIQIREVIHGPLAKFLEAKSFLVEGLRKVGMEENLMPSGKLCRFPHELGRHREGRAGSEGDAEHRPKIFVVVAEDEALAIGKDFFLGLDHILRGKAALFSGEGHGAAGGVEADPHCLRGLDLHVDEVPLAPGEKVEVIGGKGAAGKEKLHEPHDRRYVNRFLVDPAPALVQKHKPVEELFILGTGNSSEEGLVEVVMGIDHAGDHDAVAAVDDLIEGALGRRAFAQSGDAVSFHQKPGFFLSSRPWGSKVAITSTSRKRIRFIVSPSP